MLLNSFIQNSELRNRGSPLSHHLNLPRSSSEMSTTEKMLRFQDTVPCKIRAKRGCATHPRSIAERVKDLCPSHLFFLFNFSNHESHLLMGLDCFR